MECIIRGSGVVAEIANPGHYSIDVRFHDSTSAYTDDGRWHETFKRTLFYKGTVKLVAVEQQYKPQYNTGAYLYAMKDGKITVLEVKQDCKDRIVDDEDFVFLKSDYTFHLPA